MEINEILKERGENYGSFSTQAEKSQWLKDIITRKHKENLKPYQLEALDMIFHKIARILNGNPNYIESWRDISGYAELVVNELQKTEGATDGRVVKQIVQNGKMVDIH